ncbi:transmembrane 7 superfamily member 3-like [Battus philenor]|uniref:transmembrane 7 superfamily member 3-like n=1 Tax=Battus philenor TaxID=42288 RepID=UPI0035D0A6E8
MLTDYFYCKTLLIILVSVLSVKTQNATVTIPLNNTITLENKELFGDFVSLNASSTLQIGFINITKSVSFIILQVHSHFYNVTVYNNTFTRSSSVYGTNVGMYSSVKPSLDKFFIINENAVNIKLYLSVHGYGAKDPIPGGCNMEFQPPVSPYLHVSYTKDYVLVESASARDTTDPLCTSLNNANVIFYLMYLPERKFDSDTFFEGIRNMMTLDNIIENGVVVPETTWRMRRMLSAYPGTGSIYVAVAYSSTNSSAYSVYVPTYTYACSPTDESGCELLDDMLSQLLCTSLLFFGLFMCFFGHRFFKTEMFLVGLLSGVIITYILISLIADLERPALLGASTLSGMFFGAIWLLFWWFYGIPVLAVMLSTLNLGFLFAALVNFGLPGGLALLQVDFNFWTVYVFIMTFSSLMLLSMTFISNILCCAILGAYATIYPIDYFVGSNLKYIINNTIRRAVVPKFNSAVLSPPFQLTDVLVMLLWLTLAITGFFFQHYQNRLKPPFPPPPRSVRPAMPGVLYGSTGQIRGRNIYETTNTTHNENSPLLS